jgi:hypothetical protein
MARHRPIANTIQQELRAGGRTPPRTIVAVKALDQGDFFEAEDRFYLALKR